VVFILDAAGFFMMTDARLAVRRTLIAGVAILAALVSLATVLAIMLDAGYLKGPLVRFISGRIGREIQVHGRLSVELFTFHPKVSAERVDIGNPAWTPPGLTAQIGTLSIVLTIPGRGTSLGVERMEMDAATFYLARDSTGHANWQMSNPDLGSPASSPIVRNLQVPAARVSLDDAPRHLHFEGTVSVDLFASRGRGK
jgi:uncharacterized protein involved in outer membrane biogenesis